MKIQSRYLAGIPALVIVGFLGGSVLMVALGISLLATLTDLVNQHPDDDKPPPP